LWFVFVDLCFGHGWMGEAKEQIFCRYHQVGHPTS
jgi:hypothetical protein